MPSKIIACVCRKTTTAEDRILIDIALDVFGVIIIEFFGSNVKFKKSWCDIKPDFQVIAYMIEEDIEETDFKTFLAKLNIDDYQYIMEYGKRKIALEMGLQFDKFESLLVELAKLDMEGLYFEKCEELVRNLESKTIVDYVHTIIKIENLIIE